MRPPLKLTLNTQYGLRHLSAQGVGMTAITSEDQAALAEAPTALDRVRLAGDLMDRYRQALSDLSAVRGDGIVEMRLIGRMSDEEIAAELGISRQQVFKLGKEALERLFPDDDVKTMRQADRALAATFKGSHFSDWLTGKIRDGHTIEFLAPPATVRGGRPTTPDD